MSQKLFLKSISILPMITLFYFSTSYCQPSGKGNFYDEFLMMPGNTAHFLSRVTGNKYVQFMNSIKRGIFPKFPAESISHPDDIYWDDRFSFPGINGIVYAIAVSADGDVYVGGNFTLAGTTRVNNIARWDGEKWHDVGGGVTEGTAGLTTVRSIICVGNDVYVGGDFERAGHNKVKASFVARWDGRNWHSLGDIENNGPNDVVYALAYYKGELYVGGLFWKVGRSKSILANFIARWNGESWSTLGIGPSNGTDGPVLSLHNSNSLLYVGGYFNYAGGKRANNIAVWDGAHWFTVGTGAENGVNNSVYALTSVDGVIYLGGKFTRAGSHHARYVVRWDGNEWLPLGGAGSNGVNYSVYALAPDEWGRVYVGGAFSATSSDSASRIALWDRERWVALDSGLGGGIWIYPAIVFALAKGEDGVYAGGSFTTFGNKSANCIVKRVNDTWQPLVDGPGLGINDKVITIAAGRTGEIYAGGGFTAVGEIAANNIAMWDGKYWHALGSGIGKRFANIDPVSVIKIDESGHVYVGGTFVSAGGVAANNIAMWDGNKWHSIGEGKNNGLNDAVYAMAFGPHGELYVGGEFTMAGGVPANYVAVWDGTSWKPLGSDSTNGVGDRVYALAVDNMGRVYVGGVFFTAGGDTVNKIAMWDGRSWHSLGRGVTSSNSGAGISDICIFNNQVYVAGYFDRADTVQANNIARWDGTRWYPLGTGNDNGVNDLVFSIDMDLHGNLYAGGVFNRAGSINASMVAKWDGSQWSGFGSGIGGGWLQLSYGAVSDVCVYYDDIYIGGGFSLAGNKPSHSFAHWNKPLTFIQNLLIKENRFYLAQNYPDPFNSSTRINYYVPYPQKVKLEIFDITGRLVRTLINRYHPAGAYFIDFNGENLPGGIYFYRLSGKSIRETRKMVLIR